MRLKIFLLLIIHLIMFSCSNKPPQKNTAVNTVAEWTGKEIKFPDNFECNLQGSDTVSSLCAELLDSEYKILLYIDSTGCTSCKLRLFEWRQLMQEADRLFPYKVKFLFFFHPQNIAELNYFLLRDRMDYPVFIDKNDTIYKLNKFPSEEQFQCFLLDKNNMVLAIGNPVLNPKIWKLYKDIIIENKKE